MYEKCDLFVWLKNCRVHIDIRVQTHPLFLSFYVLPWENIVARLAVEIRSEVRRMNEKQPVSYLCERVRVSHGMRESCVQGRLVHGDFQLALDKSVVLVYTNKSVRYHLNVLRVNQWSSFRGKVTFAHLNRKSSLYFFLAGNTEGIRGN